MSRKRFTLLALAVLFVALYTSQTLRAQARIPARPFTATTNTSHLRAAISLRLRDPRVTMPPLDDASYLAFQAVLKQKEQDRKWISESEDALACTSGGKIRPEWLLLFQEYRLEFDAKAKIDPWSLIETGDKNWEDIILAHAVRQKIEELDFQEIQSMQESETKPMSGTWKIVVLFGGLWIGIASLANLARWWIA